MEMKQGTERVMILPLFADLDAWLEWQKIMTPVLTWTSIILRLIEMNEETCQLLPWKGFPWHNTLESAVDSKLSRQYRNRCRILHSWVALGLGISSVAEGQNVNRYIQLGEAAKFCLSLAWSGLPLTYIPTNCITMHLLHKGTTQIYEHGVFGATDILPFSYISHQSNALSIQFTAHSSPSRTISTSWWWIEPWSSGLFGRYVTLDTAPDTWFLSKAQYLRILHFDCTWAAEEGSQVTLLTYFPNFGCCHNSKFADWGSSRWVLYIALWVESAISVGPPEGIVGVCSRI